jgi:sulfane dehydrogenase subunit SoxC
MAGPRMDAADQPEQVAGNGLLHRRLFLTHGLLLAGAAGVAGHASAQATPQLKRPEWMTRHGAAASGYGQPSKFEEGVKRFTGQGNPLFPGVGASRTPLEKLTGMITPNGLHFERHHASVPEINPDAHRLLIHGLVRQPLAWDMSALMRYPMTSAIRFVECSGNSAAMKRGLPQTSCGQIHGLVSCSEWTGVKLSHLLDETGLADGASWIIAEGAEATSMVRSIPLEKALDDVIVALYQNGERIRPEQGYPMRLLVPGCEGSVNVKWVHRIKVVSAPGHSRDETGQYTDLMPDGRALQYSLTMGVKSVITHPSVGMKLSQSGLYEVSGLAWSGHGAIRRVEVTADGGKSWADAELSDPILPKCLTRFRIPWSSNGGPATLASRAIDDRGNVQPSHEAAIAPYAESSVYHYNAIQPWAVSQAGEVANVRM